MLILFYGIICTVWTKIKSVKILPIFLFINQYIVVENDETKLPLNPSNTDGKSDPELRVDIAVNNTACRLKCLTRQRLIAKC